MKKCSKCKIEKELGEFSNRKDSKDGLRADCKKCVSERYKQWAEANKEKVQSKAKQYYQENKEHILERTTEYGKRPEVRDRNREYSRRYRKREDTQEKRKAYFSSEEYKKYKKKYDKEYVNRPEVKKRRAQITLERFEKFPELRVAKNVTSNIYQALKKQGVNKNGISIMRYLPYTIEELKEHLEKQFDENMTWDNYGSYWHLDHVYPQSKLIYDSMEHPNFLKCWCLENLQPLEALENLSKGNKIIDGI